MRFMVIVKATKDSEAGVLPTEQQLADMGRFNEELAKAGVMLAGEGLQASSKGARIKFSGSARTVTDGPFPQTDQLVAGFWIIRARSKDEAIEWMKRAPFEDGEIEIRQIFEAEDFGPALTPELQDSQRRMREEITAKL
ncbi:MAG: YciI family protein [Candidatus Eremiobacteraeota bacterium]|nr:YciI family protein [Candidatus Eremiobacteraeota bacterium]